MKNGGSKILMTLHRQGQASLGSINFQYKQVFLGSLVWGEKKKKLKNWARIILNEENEKQKK